MVEVEASESGVGAILSQRLGENRKLQPVAFFFTKLSPASSRTAVEEWWHWLEGAKNPFTVFTDHKNLEYIKSAKRLNLRQAQWALFLTCFNLNAKADVLSRIHFRKYKNNEHEPILLKQYWLNAISDMEIVYTLPYHVPEESHVHRQGCEVSLSFGHTPHHLPVIQAHREHSN